MEDTKKENVETEADDEAERPVSDENMEEVTGGTINELELVKTTYGRKT